MSLIKYRNGNALKVESAFGATSTIIAMEDRVHSGAKKNKADHGDTAGSGHIARHHSTVRAQQCHGCGLTAFKYDVQGLRQPFMIRRSFELTAILILIALTSISSAQAPMQWKI